ncbi:MAG: ATP phosphoribosyltransferase regulatory subunit [Pseudomonadota bacterium]
MEAILELFEKTARLQAIENIAEALRRREEDVERQPISNSEVERLLRDFHDERVDGLLQAGFSARAVRQIVAVPELLKLALSPFVTNAGYMTGAQDLIALRQMIGECGYEDRIKIDPSVVRGLEYYTGMVYEAELLFPVTNEKGEEVVFGSVGGGGRYDGLVSRFRGEPVPATGFSIGVSRLMTALKNLGKISTDTPQGPVVVCVMDRDIGALASYQKMVQELRGAGIRAEMFQGNPKQFGKQLQYADRRNSPLCIIQGSDEREAGTVQIKDMIEGKREAAAIETNEEYKAARPGQYAVPQDRLIDEVKKRLSEQASDSDA